MGFPQPGPGNKSLSVSVFMKFQYRLICTLTFATAFSGACVDGSEFPMPTAPSQLEAGLGVTRPFRIASARRGLQPEYTTPTDGAIFDLGGLPHAITAPTLFGPGIRIVRLDSPNRQTDVTATLLPTEYGRPFQNSAVAVGDLNGDGQPDLLLGRHETAQSWAKGFLYSPANGRFEPLPFNVDLDGNGNTANEQSTFFGGTNAIDRVKRIVIADIDGDGDNDIFLGRSSANIILENLTIPAPGAARVVWDASSPNARRFQYHFVDRKDAQNDMAATRVALASDLLPRGGQEIVAADSKCSGSECPGLNPNRFVHVYGVRTDACPTVNNTCEVGETGAECPQDSIKISCKFGDLLRRPTTTSATALVVETLPNIGDGGPDILVFGGPSDANDGTAFRTCYANPLGPTCDRANYAHGRDIAIPRQLDGSFGAEVTAPAPFDNLFLEVVDAVSMRTGPSSDTRLIAAFTPYTKTQSNSALSLVAVNAGNLSLLDCASTIRDDAGEGIRIFAHDIDADGRRDLTVFANVNSRTYFDLPIANSACLTLDHAVPVTQRNFIRPVLADFDGDGDIDVFMGAWSDTVFDTLNPVLYLNRGDGSYDNRSDLLPGPFFSAGAAVATDFDGDGDIDIVQSTMGPLQFFRNSRIETGALTFVQDPSVFPPWYTTGGLIHGYTWPNCSPYPGTNNRCYPMSLLVDDFDGNGRPDIALALRKGRNDILFNNFQNACANCGRAAFVSARDDLAITDVLPSNQPSTWSSTNRTNALLDWHGPNGEKGVIALANIAADTVGPYDQLHVSHIASPFPRAQVCVSDLDCAGGTCIAHGPYQPTLKTCRNNGIQAVAGGWFEPVPLAITPRDEPTLGSDVVRHYGNLTCAASADLDRNGYTDFFALTSGVEQNVDLSQNATLNLPEGGCRSLTSQPANPTNCDVLYTCYPWKCQATNPTGLKVGLAGIFPEEDARCCTEQILVNGPVAAPACNALAANDAGRCEVVGYKRSASYADGSGPQIAKARIFAYLYDPATSRFVKVANPTSLTDANSKDSLFLDCATGDVDGDGDPDLAVVGYMTGSAPEAYASLPPPLLTSTYQHRRRFRSVQPTRLWLNPDWTANAHENPFIAADFPARSDKMYAVEIANIDRDSLPEVLTSGASRFDIFDGDYCGDFQMLPPEQCDDGNRADGDGCTSNCILERCGDSVVNNAGRETCDDGNKVDNDGCNANCQREYCGDGVVNNRTETCDDGNVNNNDGCSSACQREYCGDRIVNNRIETCDDGNSLNNDGCSALCRREFCGDRLVNNRIETCDDGNVVSGDGCNANCLKEYCGDGIRNNVFEQCDDGNAVLLDGCANCLSEVKQRLWKDAAYGALTLNFASNQAEGFHFTTLTEGWVTELGGYFKGNKRVRLYERATGLLVAEAFVNAANTWSYAAIAPVKLKANTQYTLAVYLAGSGGTRRSLAPVLPLLRPKYRIDASTYISTVAVPLARPVNAVTGTMYGQVDLTFVTTN